MTNVLNPLKVSNAYVAGQVKLLSSSGCGWPSLVVQRECIFLHKGLSGPT